ncbi:hypothetical protein AB4525_15680 [Vibrio breoganii]
MQKHPNDLIESFHNNKLKHTADGGFYTEEYFFSLGPVDATRALYGKYSHARISSFQTDGMLMMFYINGSDPHFSFQSPRSMMTVGILNGEPEFLADLQFWDKTPSISTCSDITTPLYCLIGFIISLLTTDLKISSNTNSHNLKSKAIGKLVDLAIRCAKDGYLYDTSITKRPLYHQNCSYTIDRD